MSYSETRRESSSRQIVYFPVSISFFLAYWSISFRNCVDVRISYTCCANTPTSLSGERTSSRIHGAFSGWGEAGTSAPGSPAISLLCRFVISLACTRGRGSRDQPNALLLSCPRILQYTRHCSYSVTDQSKYNKRAAACGTTTRCAGVPNLGRWHGAFEATFSPPTKATVEQGASTALLQARFFLSLCFCLLRSPDARHQVGRPDQTLRQNHVFSEIKHVFFGIHIVRDVTDQMFLFSSDPRRLRAKQGMCLARLNVAGNQKLANDNYVMHRTTMHRVQWITYCTPRLPPASATLNSFYTPAVLGHRRNSKGDSQTHGRAHRGQGEPEDDQPSASPSSLSTLG